MVSKIQFFSGIRVNYFRVNFVRAKGFNTYIRVIQVLSYPEDIFFKKSLKD